MKIRIELDPSLHEEEVVIRCRSVDERVERISRFVAQQAEGAFRIAFYKNGQEFYLPPDDILFFETEGEAVFAHTEADAYRTRLRLYELEQQLPPGFIRVAKATIVNTARIYAMQRDVTGSCKVRFANTHKHVYASRRYYQALKRRMRGEG